MKSIISWFENHKDFITAVIAIGSIVITASAWLINHEYQQATRLANLEQRLVELNRDFALYHRNFLIAEQVELEEQINDLRKREDELTEEEKNRLIDLLVRRQILRKEISDLSQ